jgi:metallo-beta-lactamase family protein
MKEGFRGAIFTTAITKELLVILWDDFVRLHQSGPGGKSKPRSRRQPPPPRERDALYSEEEVALALAHCTGHPYDQTLTLTPSCRICFRDAGHILGAAIVEMWITEGGSGAGNGARDGIERKLVFSGDLGHSGKPIVRDPTIITTADALILESTYGDRNHKTMADTLTELGQAISATLATGGTVLMPVFAIGRSQDVMYMIYQLTLAGMLNRPRVFLDSPMAIRAAEVSARHVEAFDLEALSLLHHPPKNPRAPTVTFVESAAQSRSLARLSGVIILAGSGMCEGGRIQTHLLRHLDNPNSCVIFTGYQVDGTLGRRLIDGAPEVRILGTTIPVRAKLCTINGLSAHADQAGLLDWVSHFKEPKPRTFLVHGEPPKMQILADVLQQRFDITATMPEYRDLITLD